MSALRFMITLFVVVASLSCRSLPYREILPWSGERTVQEVSPDKSLPQPVMTDNSATGRRKSVPTQFYAAELVREPVVIDGKPGFRMILRGDATIVHDDTTLKAPLIYLDPGNEGRLVGGVTITDREQGLTLRAASGSYSRAKEFVSIEGLPRIEIRQGGGKPVIVTTNLLKRDLAEKKSYLDGDVRMHGERWSLLADRGVLSDDTGIMLFEKEPVLIGRDIYMSGGNIEYLTKEKKVVLKDRPFARLIMVERTEAKSAVQESWQRSLRPETQAYLKTLPRGMDPKTLPPEIQEQLRRASEEAQRQERQKKEPANPSRASDAAADQGTAINERRVLYDLSAGRIEYRFDEKGEAHLLGGVKITSETRSLYGEQFRLSGAGLSIIEADRGVKLIDRKEKMEINARLMRYDTKKRWLWLSGTPVVELQEKNGPGIRARLEAAVIERDMEKEITLARGNVHLKRKAEEAIAEIAVFREKEQKIDLTGRPFLLRGGVWVRCKKIQMLSNPDSVIFEEDLSGGVR